MSRPTGRRPARRPRRVAADPVDLRGPGARAGRRAPAPSGWPTALRRTGFPTVEIWPTAGAPAVFARVAVGRRRARRTVLVYGHHDVQPVDPLELWEHPPFEPTRRGPDGRAARPRRHRRQGQRCLPPARPARAPGRDRPRHPGGDAASSSSRARRSPARRTSPTCCGSARDRLACDVVVVTDTGMSAPRRPQRRHRRCAAWPTPRSTSAARTSTCTRARSAAPCPTRCTRWPQLLAALHDEHGRVTMPGFYDAVVPLDRPGAGADRPAAVRRGRPGWPARPRPGPRPARRATARWSGSGPGRPPRSTACGAATPAPATRRSCPADAHAKLSFRLVADQRPGGRRGRWCRGCVDAHVPGRDQGRACTAPAAASPRADPAGRTRPCRRWSRGHARRRSATPTVCFTREGGSGPEADLAEVLGAPLRVPRRRAARRPDPLAERAGRCCRCWSGRRGRGLPVVGARFTRVSPGPGRTWGP